MNENICISPLIIFIKSNRLTGFGDDLLALQFAVQNAYALHTQPHEIIEIVYPTNAKFPTESSTVPTYIGYDERLYRLVQMRLYASIKHTIGFKIIDFVTEKIHYIKNNQYICYPLHEDDQFSIRLQQHILKYFEHKPYIFKKFSFAIYLKLYNELLKFDSRIATFNMPDTNVTLFQHKTYTEKLFVEWPLKPKGLFDLNDYDSTHTLKYSFSTELRTLTNHHNLISNNQYKFISYDDYAEEYWHWHANSKFAVGPEGGNLHMARLHNAPYVLVISNIMRKKMQSIKSIMCYYEVVRRQNAFLENPTKLAPIALMFEDSYVKEIADLENQIDRWLPNHKNETAIFLPIKSSRKEKYKRLANLFYEYFSPLTSKVTLY